MLDISAQPVIKPVPLALEVWSLNHWATRKFPYSLYSSDSCLIVVVQF